MNPMKPCMPWFGFKAMWMLPALMCSSVVGVTSACMINTVASASKTAATAPSAEPASGIHKGGEVRVGLQDRTGRPVGRVAVLVGCLTADQFHVRVVVFHIGNQRSHPKIVIGLARIFQNGILRAVADLLDDFLSSEFGFSQIVGRDVGRAVGFRRVSRKCDDLRSAVDRPVDRLDERIGLHWVNQNTGRLFHHILFKGRDLLGYVVVRCT